MLADLRQQSHDLGPVSVDEVQLRRVELEQRGREAGGQSRLVRRRLRGGHGDGQGQLDAAPDERARSGGGQLNHDLAVQVDRADGVGLRGGGGGRLRLGRQELLRQGSSVDVQLRHTILPL